MGFGYRRIKFYQMPTYNICLGYVAPIWEVLRYWGVVSKSRDVVSGGVGTQLRGLEFEIKMIMYVALT